MKIEAPEGVSSETIVKRMFWLAWNACGGPFGAGILQNKPQATEDQVWEGVQSASDYPGPGHSKPGKAYGDYVFGRMIKMMVVYTEDGIDLDDSFPPQPDYQAWCVKYRTYEALAHAAIDDLMATA